MDADLIVGAAVSEALASDFAWGTNDCCTFVCDVLLELHHIDFMAPLRGRYGSEQEAMSLLGPGGLVPRAIDLAQNAGLVPVLWPWTGALLGVVSGGPGPVLALWHHQQWLVRAPRGVNFLPPHRGVMAWGL